MQMNRPEAPAVSWILRAAATLMAVSVPFIAVNSLPSEASIVGCVEIAVLSIILFGFSAAIAGLDAIERHLRAGRSEAVQGMLVKLPGIL